MTPRHGILSAVVEAIAEADGCSPHNLDYSLYDYIEADALVLLAASAQTDWQLTFEVPDHAVTVHGNGQILVDDVVRRELPPENEQTT